MLNIAELKDNRDYFLPLSKRPSKGVYFYRFIGYDDNILKFLKEYENATISNGIYIKKPIQNPKENTVRDFFSRTNENFILTLSFIQSNLRLWIRNLTSSQVSLLSEAIFESLDELRRKGANSNILKNAYVKFMCWSLSFERVLKNIGNDNIPKVLYEGEISKYEVYMLRVLLKAGCDILYVNFSSEESILKFDGNLSKAIYGKFKGTPKIHFSAINLEEFKKAEAIKEDVSKSSNKVVTNSWIKEDENFFELLEKKNTLRGILLSSSKIYNMFISYIGVDEPGHYNNRLFKLKNDLDKSDKPFVLIDSKIMNPTLEEVSAIKRVNISNRKQLIDFIALAVSNKFNKNSMPFIVNGFLKLFEEEKDLELSKLYNLCIKLLCWMIRYNTLFEFDGDNLPILIYFGELSPSEGSFLNLLSYMPIDVLYISPTKNKKGVFSKSLEFELQNSMEINEFPKSEMKVKVSTVAYNAEKEIENEIYNDTGLYKNQQFANSTPITLRTTYEEIFILWDQEAKFRPSFRTDGLKVYTPNIFAKVCGVKDEDDSKYFKSIKSLINDDTIYYRNIPFLKEKHTLSSSSLNQCMVNNKIDIDKIKQIKEYEYEYLDLNTQHYIISKIEELINLNWIKYTGSDLNNIILGTLLNLDKPTLKLIQKFDFTKNIPKIVIVDTTEEMATIYDCIYLLFLNLIGFDIVIFTPTGYRNIEKFIMDSSFENHIIGEFMFNLKAPNFKTSTAEKKSFFERFFG